MKILFYIKKIISPKTVFYVKKFFSKFLSPSYIKLRNRVFNDAERNGLENIPIFIISYNRLTYLKKFVNRLEEIGRKNIIIIDNASTYKPLLEYYNEIPYKVIRLKKNGGHMVFWENPIFQEYRENFYMISDPDIVPVEECPENFVEYFFAYLKRYPFVRKIGFSLKIDDISEKSIFRNEVIEWESQFNKILVDKRKLYYAPIDTTFALYLPDLLVKNQAFCSAFRTAYPYQARHLPWYKTKDMVDDEDVFYSQHKKNGWWDVTKEKMTPDDAQNIMVYENKK